jgi:hypothetical protein
MNQGTAQTGVCRIHGIAERRSLVSLFTRIIGRGLFLRSQNVAGFVLAIEMQFDQPRVELAHHGFDAPLDRRKVGAVPGDEFLDNGS